MTTTIDIPVGKSYLWYTGSTNIVSAGVGHGAAPYSQDELTRLFMALFTPDPAVQGVINHTGSELKVQQSATSELELLAGWAIVHGFPYELRAVATIPISSIVPAIGETGFYIGLRADWTLNTVYPCLYASDVGTAGLPDLLSVQITGSEWLLPLASGRVDAAGVATLTDMRESTSGIGSAAFSLANYSINDLGDVDIIGDPQVGDTLAYSDVSGVVALRLATGAVATDPIAAISIDPLACGSLILEPSADGSVLGSQGSAFTSIAWTLKDASDAVIESASGAPAAAVSGGTYFTGGTYANPTIDLGLHPTVVAGDALKLELEVTDDTPRTSATAVKIVQTSVCQWFDLRSYDYSLLGVYAPTDTSVSSTSSSWSTTGAAALSAAQGAHGMEITVPSAQNKSRLVRFGASAVSAATAHSFDIVWYRSSNALNRMFIGIFDQDSTQTPSSSISLYEAIAAAYDWGGAIQTIWGSNVGNGGAQWQQTGSKVTITSGNYYRLRIEDNADNGSTVYYGQCNGVANSFAFSGTPASFTISSRPITSPTNIEIGLIVYGDLIGAQNFAVTAFAVDLPFTP